MDGWQPQDRTAHGSMLPTGDSSSSRRIDLNKPPSQPWAQAQPQPAPVYHQPQQPYYQPQPIYVTQQVQMSPAYVMVGQPKSMAAAMLLTFFFGPLGLLYVSVTGAVVMLIVSVLLAVMTLGFSILLTFPACMVWAAIATNNHNARLAAAPHYSQNVR